MIDMKKICLLPALLLLLSLPAMAQESISVDEVLVPQGHQGLIPVKFHFSEGHKYVSYQFKVELPEGISFVTESGVIPVKLGDGQPANIFKGLDLNASSHNVTCYSNPSTIIDGKDGVLVYIPIEAESTLAVGTELTGSLTGVAFADIDAVSHSFPNSSFTIKITDEIILDENSPVAPQDAANVKVRVKRTIKANQWSTLCLPFDMTVAQLKTVFGDDVELAEFSDYEAVTDGSDVTSLTVNFVDADLTDGFYGNWPYLIKTSKDITEFTIDGVSIVNDVASAVAEYDNGKTGRQRKVFGKFIGTYEAGTIVPDESLFLSDNKFWYSVGNTKIKAFRAYFTFNDVLSSLNGAGVKMFFGDAETRVNDIKGDEDESVYDLGGRKLADDKSDAHIHRGVYIVNGQKVIVK